MTITFKYFQINLVLSRINLKSRVDLCLRTTELRFCQSCGHVDPYINFPKSLKSSNFQINNQVSFIIFFFSDRSCQAHNPMSPLIFLVSHAISSASGFSKP